MTVRVTTAGRSRETRKIRYRVSLRRFYRDIFCRSLSFNGSGRTDAGVHAACQTANFKVDYSKKNAEKDMVDMSTPAAIMDELNGFLPEDIRIFKP